MGLIYEARACAYLAERFAEHFTRGPWVIFNDVHGRERWCQPDGIILDPPSSRVVIVETKLRHCSEAWFQLFDLYRPVVAHMFPDWGVAGVEVCRWFDPAVLVPAKPRMRENPLDAVDGEFNVHIWAP